MKSYTFEVSREGTGQNYSFIAKVESNNLKEALTTVIYELL